MRINLIRLLLLLSVPNGVACRAPNTPREVSVEAPSAGSGSALRGAEQADLDGEFLDLGDGIELPARVERRVAMMGTWLRLEVDAGQRSASLSASEAAVRALESTEARLSTWRADSELSKLNHSPQGDRFPLSSELARDLELAKQLWSLTEGAFDPGVGSLLQAWGVRTGGRLPSALELSRARAASGFQALELGARFARRRHAGLVIEEGAFGKGIGLDLALEELERAGVRAAFMDLGGQVALLGGESISLGLADPRDRERPLLSLSIDSGSFATSGNSERGLLIDGESYGHLIDPRSGLPAPDFGSLSVWAPSATWADALSTGLYVLGPERALKWALAHPNIEIIVLMPCESGMLAIATPGWQGRLESMDRTLEVRILKPESQL